MSAFPRPRTSSALLVMEPFQKRLRSSRAPQSARIASPPPPPQVMEIAPALAAPEASDEALINDLEMLEARVAELLREVQKNLADINGYMLSGIMTAFVASVAGVRDKVPDLLNLRHVNETLEDNVHRMRNLE
jgi:hypothetical protein